METKITKINALPKLERKLRVAAYCRVSSGKDAMLHSLSNQVSYYNKLIQSTQGWEFAGVYADEAISGTKDTREEFNRLIADCKQGKIDLILVKSISRFARNTLTMLETIRELKDIGVNVFFEEQNLHSISGEGEMVLTFLASFAQEEARSTSENMKWRVRKNYEQGIAWSTKPMYGYRFDENKNLVIIPEEAELVKRIYNLYIDGFGIVAIANLLNEEKVKPMYAKTWKKSSISAIISNINYTGDMLLQKFYISDYMTKKLKKNNGELNQYLVENNHEPIITKETFNYVQELRLKRAAFFKLEGRKYEKNIFAGILKCGICGGSYIHKTTKYSKKWLCKTFNHKGKKYCASKAVPEDELARLIDEVTNGKTELIKEGIVYQDNRIVFNLTDETSITKYWKDISRKNSWTPEMKEKARQRTLENGTAFKKGGSKMAKVTIIPSKKDNISFPTAVSITKRKVAAYARVSTDSDEQFTSFESQCNYYENYIKSRSDWEYVGVYADEGISGTNTKNRVQFKKMIDDALDGKIGLIITKSISRFARNTLDTIAYTRKLKSKGVEVYFEKENLWTFDDKAEFLLAIMSSIAQEESRSISQNVTMGKRWRMKEGKVSFAYKNFLGYKKENGKIVIDEEQATIVRYIYKEFLVNGKSCTGIAEDLKSKGVKTPMGKTNWTKNTITSILKNEKYKGDAILQKTYVKNFLEHKAVKNNGELPKYVVENSHPEIIDRNMWEMVQAELFRRNQIGASYSSSSIFSSKLICGDCGGFYGKKVWHSTDEWRKEIYRCNKKYSKDKTQCQTPNLNEEEIKTKFIKAYNQLLIDKERVINDAKEIINLLTDTTEIDVKIVECENELEIVSELVKKLVRDNSNQEQSQNDYAKKYEELETRYNKARKLHDELVKKREIKTGKMKTLNSYLAAFENSSSGLDEWDNNIWMTALENAIVNKDGTITFNFIVGKSIKI